MIIRALNIRYRYDGQQQNLFEKVNCEIAKGDKIGLIGDNGTGKTTLLKIILGEEKPIAENCLWEVISKLGIPPRNYCI